MKSGSRWRNKRNKRIAVVVRLWDKPIGNQPMVDYRYEAAVGGHVSTQSTSVDNFKCTFTEVSS